MLRWAARGVAALVALAVLGALGWGGWRLWENRVPPLLPRHRPEAICFRLAETPAFAPPMTVEPSVALVRGRFSPHTPPGVAVREAMGLADHLVISEHRRPVGDFDVASLWVRVPGRDGHWLVLGWMEGGDLATASFHFPSEEGALSREALAWGDRLMARALVPAHFRSDGIPSTSWRPRGRATLPVYGPALVAAR